MENREHPNIRMQSDYNSYGEEAFKYEIIENTESIAKAKELEEKIISQGIAENLYNVASVTEKERYKQSVQAKEKDFRTRVQAFLDPYEKYLKQSYGILVPLRMLAYYVNERPTSILEHCGLNEGVKNKGRDENWYRNLTYKVTDNLYMQVTSTDNFNIEMLFFTEEEIMDIINVVDLTRKSEYDGTRDNEE